MTNLDSLVAGAAGRALSPLTRRVVGVRRPRRTLSLEGLGDRVTLARTPLTTAAGTYGLSFGPDFAERALVGDVLHLTGSRVTRLVVDGSVPQGKFRAEWTGHVAMPAAVASSGRSIVDVPLRDGGSAPAWLYPGTEIPEKWAIHIQGIRTSREVTLRTVEAARRAGVTSLVITYRGAGDGPPVAASTLGQREWTDVADAIDFARERGAAEIVLVGWSMGGGIALETALQAPGAIDSLALICPATNWRKIVVHGARRAGLPAAAGRAVLWALSSPAASRRAGLAEPLDFDRLDWTREAAVQLPTIVVHSTGDDEIPVELSREFAAAHPTYVSLVETRSAPHGWEANVDPDAFYSALEGWFTRRFV